MNPLALMLTPVIIFSIAYAAMNALEARAIASTVFSIAYAAMNTKILTDC